MDETKWLVGSFLAVSLIAVTLTACGDDDAEGPDAGSMSGEDAGPAPDAAIDVDAGGPGADAGDIRDGGGEDDASTADAGLGPMDAGPPISCDAPGRLTSALLGGRDLTISLAKDGNTDSCVEAASAWSIDGVGYYRVDLEPGQGVQFSTYGTVVVERMDCGSGCGSAVEESGLLNDTESPMSRRVVLGNIADAFRPDTTVRFNDIQENVACGSARVVAPPTTVEDQNVLGAEAIEIDCPGALDAPSQGGSFLRVTVPSGATLVASSEGSFDDLAEGTTGAMSSTTVIASACPGPDGVVTCIGEERSVIGPWVYTNASPDDEEVLVVTKPGSYPRVDVSLQLE